MAKERVQRRLAAILAADVVGYSRLMEQDDTDTLTTLKSRRKEVLEPLVTRHQGRIFKFTGDGVLVEFGSAVNAVQCAIDLQHAMAAANADLPEPRHIVLRIGVTLGDVMAEGGDLCGDGVNIAARLEGIAEPGGILISGTVFDYVRNKVKAGFEELGTQTLKNIAEPERLYRIIGTPRVAIPASKGITDKPSIAVLPFANMSGDPEQEYFADGITEDIITELSRFSSLLVIARNSSFQYRNRPSDMKKVGQELGARYLVEGSVRRLGPNIRITAQLIEAPTNRHVWAERYDRQMEDLYNVQDEVVRAIVTSTEHRLVDSQVDYVSRQPPNSWVAYDYYLQGRKLLFRYETQDKAEAPLLRAIELDPMLAEAYAKLAVTQVAKYWADYDPAHLDKALDLARQSLSLNETSDAHASMSMIYAFQDRMDPAIVHADRALSLNPNNTHAAVDRASWQLFIGDAKGALARLDEVLKRDPIPPTWYWDSRGAALFQLKRYREAIDALNMVSARKPWENSYMAAAMAYLGQIEDARKQVAVMLVVDPTMTATKILKTERYQSDRYRKHLVDGLRIAGLPE